MHTDNGDLCCPYRDVQNAVLNHRHKKVCARENSRSAYLGLIWWRSVGKVEHIKAQATKKTAEKMTSRQRFIVEDNVFADAYAKPMRRL